MTGSGSAVPTWPGGPLAAPPPPPGPGVQPPFVAPPTDGTRRRRWIAVGISAGVAVFLCIAGAAGLGGLLVFGTRALQEQAQARVEEYLTALREAEYQQAYGLLCDGLQASTSPAQFEQASRDGPQVSSFDVGEAVFGPEDIRVPTTVDYADGTVRQIRFLLDQDSRTGQFEVCGEAD